MPTVLPIPRPRISPADLRKRRYEKNERNQEFYDCIKDIIDHPVVLQMKNYYQHCETDCYEHCLNVAYNNFCICKYLGLDARSAARGGMLHDLFLYDWRKHSRRTGDHLHAITHPIAAYRNARKYFKLNKREKEVITKHMWPVSLIPPRYPETYVICLTDKYCGSMEIADHYSGILKNKFWGRPAAWLMKKAFSKVPRANLLQQLVPEIDSMDSAAIPESFAQQRQRVSSGWNHSSGRRRRFS
ncbi:MAG: HD domain-containing protein [Clostridia bacterium]|nr:HD domain-containing protein [Clostridia bacterium]NCC42406.1 HD domain-containing protein [Clostridia bacterium]